LLERLWTDGTGVVSVQVLQELYVTLTRKIARPLDAATVRGIVADLAAWHIVRPTELDVLAAIDASVRWQLSFWDAMILTTAQIAGATTLWSEDLSAEQTFDGLNVKNPFGK
jgi:predicted nucleic acid-binding protein